MRGLRLNSVIKVFLKLTKVHVQYIRSKPFSTLPRIDGKSQLEQPRGCHNSVHILLGLGGFIVDNLLE